MDSTNTEVTKATHKRNRQSDCFQEDACSEFATSKDEIIISAKKPRDDISSVEEQAVIAVAIEDSMQSTRSNDDDYDDDDYDDIDEVDDNGNLSDNDDFLEDFEDDQSVASSASTTVSTGSSVCSNTPSLVGENLESFSLGEQSEGNAAANSGKKNPWALNTPMVKTSAPPLRRSLFSNVPPTINFVHHNEVTEVSLPAELRKLLRYTYLDNRYV